MLGLHRVVGNKCSVFVLCSDEGLCHTALSHACNEALVVVAAVQIKGTVLLMPNGSDKVTSAPEQKVETDKKVEDAEVLQLLATSLKPRKSSKKKSGAKAAEATA
jgi:hypothetical protein